MWVLLTNRVVLVCLILAAGDTATAQSDAGQAINFDRAIANTLESNPALRAFGYEIEAQQGRIRQSDWRPAVELSVEIENVAGTGNFSGFDGAEATISLAWALERGKRQNRVDAARAGLSVLESEAFENLYFGGKCIAADDRAIASARVMGTCLATGYAAGRMAALRVQGQSREENIAQIRLDLEVDDICRR